MLLQVRDDPVYLQNVVKLSMLLKDRRGSPMDDAVWLIEFLARNKGAEHLKISSRNLNLFEYYSVDSSLIIFSMFLLILTISYLLARKLFQSTQILFARLADNFSSHDKIKVLWRFFHVWLLWTVWRQSEHFLGFPLRHFSAIFSQYLVWHISNYPGIFHLFPSAVSLKPLACQTHLSSAQVLMLLN